MVDHRKKLAYLLLSSIFVSQLNVAFPAPFPKEDTALNRIEPHSSNAAPQPKSNEKDRSLAPLTTALESGVNSTAGEAFKKAISGGAETPFTIAAEFLDLVTTAFGRGKLDERKGPLDTIFYIVPEVIGSVGETVIDTVGNLTGTQTILRPFVALAGGGMGWGIETASPLLPARLAIKGGYDAVKTLALITGLDGLLGLKFKESKNQTLLTPSGGKKPTNSSSS
ncbi:unnamed protein product [Allacma fusca]|uniref:Uncharacterized protein n=1 Tax=Allacma fusca TaxID=39272 RepID=A0A8J2JTH1_9HEXA|nr:unnamed protein product [Allacma fusca]